MPLAKTGIAEKVDANDEDRGLQGLIVRGTNIVAPWCIAIALLVGGTNAGLAQSVDCVNPGDLQTAIDALTANQTLTITGICSPASAIVVNIPGVTLIGSATIDGPVIVFASNVVLAQLTIDGALNTNAQVGIEVIGQNLIVNNCTIQNWPNNGIEVDNYFSVTIFNSFLQNNSGFGIEVQTGGSALVGGGAQYDQGAGPVTVSGNGTGGVNATSASLQINEATISGNTGGPALQLTHSSAEVTGGGTISSPTGLMQPTILMLHSALKMIGPSLTVTGSGQSNAIYAEGNSTVTMQSASVADDDANDPTILVDDGSALFSMGGNTISNIAASGIAIEASNGSSFHQHIAKQFNAPAAADMITGAGSVQVESNMELGTGALAPSSWSGTINVAQNSSLRMDGGITVTGAAKLSQASNGFFNVSNGGLNIITGGVTCPATTNLSAHVAGPTLVLLTSSGPSAVTIGNAPPDCLAF
ncbi:MAG TPA: right-handed parallel beta-helix repeat-containing protein [Stellaceae bacterium]|nr:right-handed parallel beta-helix repeat-containing protein [Stellaceae bacterium]